jgi:hypothetical protein
VVTILEACEKNQTIELIGLFRGIGKALFTD